MLGAEGVASSLRTTLEAALPGRLAAVRAAVGCDVDALPDPKEWQDFEESRGTWDMSRLPLVQIVARSVSGAKAAHRSTTGDSWEFRYNVQILVVLAAGGADGWQSADRVRKRYLLALRECLWTLPAGVLRVEHPSVTERLYTPRVSAGGAAVQADATVTFDVIATEIRARAIAGKANEIDLHLVAVPVDDPMPAAPPNPLPAPVVIPAG